jgi:hypothetical protein
LLAVVFAVCYLFFAYAFTSVWCFFAAVLSLLVCYGFYRHQGHTGVMRSSPG